MQLSTSYLRLGLVERVPVLGEVNTGPGGMYSRLEELGHQIHFEESVTCRLPTGEEQAHLEIDMTHRIVVSDRHELVYMNREEADPAELARRELAEETGLRARNIQRLGYLRPAKGMSSQACTVFTAGGLEAGQHAREHEEQDMRQRWFSQTNIESMIQNGTITTESGN